MPAIANSTRRYLETGPPAIEWFLVTAPWGDPVFQARVNDAGIEKGDRTIVFDGVVGSWLNVEAGMTLWVGSVAGAYDVGRVRIREVGPNWFEVAENDHIVWENNQYLTVPGEAGFREPWSVYQRLTESGGTVTFYKDYDIEYTNEGDHLPPKANAGPPAIGEIDLTTGQVVLDWIGEDSYTTELTAGISGSFWTFPGGIPATSTQLGTQAAPIQVAWGSPGFRYVRLDIVDSLGTTGTTFVPTWILDESTGHGPYNKVKVTEIYTGMDGLRMSVEVFGANPIDFADRSLVALGIRSWFGGQPIELGGYHDRENLYASGWIVGSTIHYDSVNQSISFEILSTDGILGIIPGFSFYLEHDTTPTTWYEMNYPTLDRIKHHHLQYHTNINEIAHVEQYGEGVGRWCDRRGFPDTNPRDQLQTHLLDGAMNSLVCDRQGIFRMTRDPQMMDAADRNTIPIVTTLSSTTEQSDWLEDIDVVVRHRSETGFLDLGGFVNGTTTPLLSKAPGDAPSQNDASDRINGIILVDQDEANLWSGLAWSKDANRWPQVSLLLKGFWPVFEPALQEYIRLGFVDPWGVGPAINTRAVVREVNIQILQDLKSALTELVVEPESTILEGVTIPVPSPPSPINPSPPPLPPAPPGYEGELKRCILRTSQGIIITENIHQSNADIVWERRNVNLTTGQFQSIRDMAFDFADGDRLFMVVDDSVEGGAFRCSDIWNGAAWEQRFDNQYIFDLMCVSLAPARCTALMNCSDPNLYGTWWAVGCDPVSGHLTFIAGMESTGAQNCQYHKWCMYSGDALNTVSLGDDFVHDPFTTCGGSHCATPWAGAGSITSSGDVWLFTYACAWGAGSDRHRGISSSGGVTVFTGGSPVCPGQIWTLSYHIWHTRVDKNVIFYTDQGTQHLDLSFSGDRGWTYTNVSPCLPDTPADSGQSLTMHFLNTAHVMYVDKNGKAYYSTTGGLTWTQCPTTPDGAHCIAACGDSIRIPAGMGYLVACDQPTVDTEWIKLTDDLGQTWTNKTGNLGDLLDHNSDTIYEIIPVQDP